MVNYDLVILAGGKETRIRKQLKGYPKPLAKFSNFYFLDYLLFFVSKFLFENIYIIAGFKGHLIKKNYHNKRINVSNITVFVEKKLKGTAGALKELNKKIKNDFYLTNGDSLFDINFFDFIKNRKKNQIGIMSLVKNNNYKENKKLSSLNLNFEKKIIYSSKKSKLMNGGIYFFKKNILKLIHNKVNSLENDLLPKLIKSGKLTGKIFNSFFLDIGTPKNFSHAKKNLKKKFTKPAIFLDRDGVLNHDRGYTYKLNDLRIIKKTIKYLKNKKNYYLFIVTNQAGIAKGKYSTKAFLSFQKNLLAQLCKEKIYINDFEFCPHHPHYGDKKFKQNCNCRKPKNGMIEKLFQNWPIIREKSVFIGDKDSDKIAAIKSRLRYIDIKSI